MEASAEGVTHQLYRKKLKTCLLLACMLRAWWALGKES